MAEKRQVESTESGIGDESNKKHTKLSPMIFDEVAAIIRSGDSEKLKKIIEAGRVNNINMRSSCYTGFSLLMVACESGFLECARVLLDHNAVIRANSTIVLKSACLSGNADLVRFIIERGHTMNDSIVSYLFGSPEIVANTEVAATLVGYIQDVNAERGAFLRQVCRVGNLMIARILLLRGASLFSAPADPLAAAAGAGHLEVVKLLIGWRTNIGTGVSQASVNEAVIIASRSGLIEIVRCLIEYGTGVKADILSNALYGAVEYHRLEVTTFLLDNGGDYNALLPTFRCSTWILACQIGSPDMVRLMLDRGADPNAVEARVWSPLKSALKHAEVLKILLEHNADPNQPFAYGSTALLDVVKGNNGGYMQTLTVLLGHGADPNLAHATTGQTALMIAALELRIEAVKLLLEYGADVTQVNREGQSVLDQTKYSEVVALCTQYVECNKPGAKLLLK